jgi:hypothetical protein
VDAVHYLMNTAFSRAIPNLQLQFKPASGSFTEIKRDLSLLFISITDEPITTTNCLLLITDEYQ